MDKDNSIFSIRFDKLIKSFKNFTSNTIRKDKKYHTNYLRIVNFTNCNSYEDIKIMHDYFVTEGYEGIILRKDEQYKNTRSSNLLKYKEFDDDEMEIIGFSEGVGTEVGLVIWEVKTNDGLIFTVRPKGDFEERKKLFENGEKYIGKKITVRFQGKSEKGIPRFPIGISIRDYE
jgi:ATP-dependent DNA ligase